jgi:hypothetical protein
MNTSLEQTLLFRDITTLLGRCPRVPPGGR